MRLKQPPPKTARTDPDETARRGESPSNAASVAEPTPRTHQQPVSIDAILDQPTQVDRLVDRLYDELEDRRRRERERRGL